MGCLISVTGPERMRSMSAQDDAKPIVIVGAGLTGGNAAATLRDEGFRGRVVLIGHEPGVPFGRPPLSKTYLRSEEDLDGWYVRPPDWYEEHDVERLEATVTAVDPAAHKVVLDSGEEIEYEKVLIATGGRNRRLDIPGAELPGVHQLRTVAECDAIKGEAVADRHAVVVGMSFIGCEVTASLTQLGVRVTSAFPQGVPLERVLGEEVGAVIGGFHRAEGVELLAETHIAAFEGTERVEAAVTADGDRIECDFAVVGIGIEPDVPTFASPVEQENGVLVDELLRTSAADVYAAGDVANQLHPVFGRVRVEHYNNAEKMGGAAARSMLGSTLSVRLHPHLLVRSVRAQARVRRPRDGMGRVRGPREPGGRKADRLLHAGGTATGSGRGRSWGRSRVGHRWGNGGMRPPRRESSAP